MKKIFSLMTVFVMVFALTIPCFASGDFTARYNGHELPVLPHDLGEYTYIKILGSETTAYGTSAPLVYHPDINMVRPSTDTVVNCYVYQKGSWAFKQLYNFSADTNLGILSTYIWSNVDLKGTDGNVYLHGSLPDIIYCDGSSCAAADVNFDDICDDCGLPLAYELRVTPDSYEIVISHSETLTLKHVFTETLTNTTFGAVYDDSRITVSFDNPVNHYQYKLVNGEWEEYASYPNIYDYHTISLPDTSEILSSDLTIYDTNGDPFFQNPLWMMVEQVTQGGMKEAAAEVFGTMTTLTLCGVGLMACLMAFVLFGKRWLIFLR